MGSLLTILQSLTENGEPGFAHSNHVSLSKCICVYASYACLCTQYYKDLNEGIVAVCRCFLSREMQLILTMSIYLSVRLSIHLLVGWLVPFYFFSIYELLSSPLLLKCPSDILLHATGVAIYPALISRPVYCSVFPPTRWGGENNQRVWRKGRKRKEEKREKKENLGKIKLLAVENHKT